MVDESKGIAYSDGQFIPVHSASVPLLRTGFLRSDAVFDAMSVWQGNFFRLDDHMARFDSALKSVRMTSPFSDTEMRRIAAQCVDRSGLENAVVYILCTRGRDPDGRAFADPRTCIQEFSAFSLPYYSAVPEECAKTGAHLYVAETRRAPSSAINQRCKNFNRMDLTRAQFEALDAGAHQPVLLSIDGYLTEGPGFNLWIVSGGDALTPGEHILEGITRRTVFDLCSEIGCEARVVDLTPDELQNADEAFISSTAGGIFPVSRVNDRPIGNGAPGSLTSALRDLYWDRRKAGWHGTPVADLLAAPSVAEKT